jgi:hypothetical protein
MSDEHRQNRKRFNWGSIVMFAVGTAAAYQGVHYATSATILEPLGCVPILAHTIGGKRVPEFVESCFGPAEWIDERLPRLQWKK